MHFNTWLPLNSFDPVNLIIVGLVTVIALFGNTFLKHFGSKRMKILICGFTSLD